MTCLFLLTAVADDDVMQTQMVQAAMDISMRVDGLANYLEDQAIIIRLNGSCVECLSNWDQPDLSAYQADDAPASLLPECVSDCDQVEDTSSLDTPEEDECDVD